MTVLNKGKKKAFLQRLVTWGGAWSLGRDFFTLKRVILNFKGSPVAFGKGPAESFKSILSY